VWGNDEVGDRVVRAIKLLITGEQGVHMLEQSLVIVVNTVAVVVILEVHLNLGSRLGSQTGRGSGATIAIKVIRVEGKVCAVASLISLSHVGLVIPAKVELKIFLSNQLTIDVGPARSDRLSRSRSVTARAACLAVSRRKLNPNTLSRLAGGPRLYWWGRSDVWGNGAMLKVAEIGLDHGHTATMALDAGVVQRNLWQHYTASGAE
jgi:hypothetical protein